MFYTGNMTSKSPGTNQYSYRAIAEELASRIQQGEYQEGDKLGSELYLSEEFGVARGTMRKALDILKRQHMIQTRSGVGSFVAFHGHSMESTPSWTDAIAKTGSISSTKVISIEKMPPTTFLKATYHVDCDIYRITRCRMSGEDPVSVEISSLPSNKMLDLLMERGLLGGSIALTMKAAGMIPYKSVQDATVGTVPELYGKQLNAQETDRYLIVNRASLDSDGKLIEYVISSLNPNHFSLHMEFERTEENEGNE